MRNQTGVSFTNSNCKDLQGNRKDSIIGSPQGGIASLILANIYLHEFDAFVGELQR
jgi:retron-type reverse transcriptase